MINNRFFKNQVGVLLFFLGLLLAGGCKKYAPLAQLDHPSYLRVFNSIANTRRNGFFSGTADELSNTRMLCLLIDPTFDGKNIPVNATYTGDFLAFRAFYAGPQESFPNDDITFSFNVEFPGAYRMPVGGVINGWDASRWAQIPAGRHRILFLRRLKGGLAGTTLFSQYPSSGRDTAFRVALDTTLTLGEDKMYTLDVTNKIPTDAGPLQAMLRQEHFDTDPLSDTTKLYVNFYNYLQAAGSPDALDVYCQWEYVTNTIGPATAAGFNPFTYSQGPLTNGIYTYSAVYSPESFLTAIKEKYSVGAPAYSAVAMPATDSFYYREGPAVSQFRLPFDRPRLLLNFYLPGQSAATGAKPYLQLRCCETSNPLLLNASEDTKPQLVTDGSICSLYETITYNKVSRAFALLNSIVLMNQYSSLNTPSSIRAYQVGVQRPFSKSFITN